MVSLLEHMELKLSVKNSLWTSCIELTNVRHMDMKLVVSSS